jgi:ATP-dependent RNA helicase DHX8/PRP22
MIVFTTNVAETSLTVPGVKLVIDSGFAKEAEYYPEKRVNILELKRIAKSSAD